MTKCLNNDSFQFPRGLGKTVFVTQINTLIETDNQLLTRVRNFILIIWIYISNMQALCSCQNKIDISKPMAITSKRSAD